jgi:hypothetical protein
MFGRFDWSSDSLQKSVEKSGQINRELCVESVLKRRILQKNDLIGVICGDFAAILPNWCARKDWRLEEGREVGGVKEEKGERERKQM